MFSSDNAVVSMFYNPLFAPERFWWIKTLIVGDILKGHYNPDNSILGVKVIALRFDKRLSSKAGVQILTHTRSTPQYFGMRHLVVYWTKGLVLLCFHNLDVFLDPLFRTCLIYHCEVLRQRYAKLRVALAPGMPGTFSPSPTSKESAS